jgi:hypothetical protein
VSWKYGPDTKHQQTEDDDDENLNQMEYFDLQKRQIVVNKCQQACEKPSFSETSFSFLTLSRRSSLRSLS